MMKHFSDSKLAASILLSAGYVVVNGVWQKVSNRIVAGVGEVNILEYLYGGKAYDEDWNEVLQARIITNNLIAEEMLKGRNPEEITNEEIDRTFPNSMMKHFQTHSLRRVSRFLLAMYLQTVSGKRLIGLLKVRGS